MTTRYNDQLHEAYGRFIPGSADRDLRIENSKLGLQTCEECLEAYEPYFSGSRGKKLPWSWWYCPKCAAKKSSRSRGCRGCSS